MHLFDSARLPCRDILLITAREVLLGRGRYREKTSEEAVQLALRACKLTGYNRPDVLDTLAVAYAAAGRFGEAIETAAKAISLAEATNQQQLADQIQRHLELFERGQPYHEISSKQHNSNL